MSMIWGPALDAEVAYRAERVRHAARSASGPHPGAGARTEIAGSHQTAGRLDRRRTGLGWHTWLAWRTVRSARRSLPDELAALPELTRRTSLPALRAGYASAGDHVQAGDQVQAVLSESLVWRATQ